MTETRLKLLPLFALGTLRQEQETWMALSKEFEPALQN